MDIEISGYPSETGILPSYKQYTMIGKINTYTQYRLFYPVDTSGGQSGSPILDKNNVAIGIHTRGADSNGNNSGTRIRDGICESFEEIILKNS